MEILDAGETVEMLGLDYLNELSTFGALSNAAIVNLLDNGVIKHFARGEYVTRLDQVASEFQVLLRGGLPITSVSRGAMF